MQASSGILKRIGSEKLKSVNDEQFRICRSSKSAKTPTVCIFPILTAKNLGNSSLKPPRQINLSISSIFPSSIYTTFSTHKTHAALQHQKNTAALGPHLPEALKPSEARKVLEKTWIGHPSMQVVQRRGAASGGVTRLLRRADEEEGAYFYCWVRS